ncbi:MAG TPA: hypothetical protein VI389_01010, partial [Geobacteraceae bacterium]
MTNSGRLGTYLPLLVLLALAFVVYAGSFGHDFLPNWDDYPYVLENETIRGFTLQHLRDAFSSYFVGNYAPVHIISYMVDYALWELNPAGYVAGNILLHALSGLLFFRLLVRVGQTPAMAFVAAAIFLVHPVQVESVAWISQRKNVLAMFFFLVAFHEYLSCREGRAARGSHYFASLAALAAALLSKSVAVIFPAVVFLYDLSFPGEEKRRPGLVDKVPYLVVAAVVAGLAFLSQDEQVGGGRREYPGGSPLATFYTMLTVLPAYVRDCFVPTGLSPYYTVAVRQAPGAAVILAFIFALLLAAVGVFLWRKERSLFFFYMLFSIGLLPVSQIVPLIPLKNDRYLYFPLLGFTGLMGGILSRLWLRYERRRLALALLSVFVITSLSILSWRQASIWRDDLTLWEHAVKLDPDNEVAWLLLMKGYTRRGNGAAAAAAHEHYLELRDKNGPPRGWEKE